MTSSRPAERRPNAEWTSAADLVPVMHRRLALEQPNATTAAARITITPRRSTASSLLVEDAAVTLVDAAPPVASASLGWRGRTRTGDDALRTGRLLRRLVGDGVR